MLDDLKLAFVKRNASSSKSPQQSGLFYYQPRPSAKPRFMLGPPKIGLHVETGPPNRFRRRHSRTAQRKPEGRSIRVEGRKHSCRHSPGSNGDPDDVN